MVAVCWYADITCDIRWHDWVGRYRRRSRRIWHRSRERGRSHSSLGADEKYRPLILLLTAYSHRFMSLSHRVGLVIDLRIENVWTCLVGVNDRSDSMASSSLHLSLTSVRIGWDCDGNPMAVESSFLTHVAIRRAECRLTRCRCADKRRRRRPQPLTHD